MHIVMPAGRVSASVLDSPDVVSFGLDTGFVACSSALHGPLANYQLQFTVSVVPLRLGPLSPRHGASSGGG
jgi:hypothetical protein